MNTTYDDIVADDKQTCQACPTQWEGTLKDGRKFYFRYRWGNAYLGVSSPEHSPIWAKETPGGVEAVVVRGDGLDGYLTDDEYREVFVKLYGELK